MAKDFDRWNELKKTIEGTQAKGFVHTREVWWASLGLNVGSEQDGKNETFERPVIVLRKFNRESVLVAPITSQVKPSIYHVPFMRQGLEYAIIISQLRLISTKRLHRRIFRMPEEPFTAVLTAVQRMIALGS